MPDAPDDLALLTTVMNPSGALFSTTRDTSAATASAARMAAQIIDAYPELRPETVRALIVHSAQWTPAMLERYPGTTKAQIQSRLRCYGYGVPALSRAIEGARNLVTLVFEGALHPYTKVGSDIRSNEMHVHDLPWPAEVLQELGEEPVRMNVTLSYFIEPRPGRRGWTRRHRYASHGLRFELQRRTETEVAFLSRISESAVSEGEGSIDESSADSLPWVVGPDGRTQGSIHRDL